MPTEHEFKYVLSLDLVRTYPEAKLKSLAKRVQKIKQGYLAFSKGMTTRIRSIRADKKTKWYMTFKQKVTNRVIEIETKISRRDGSDLWEVCVGKLSKERYDIVDDFGNTWEVDLFKKGDHLYFAMAEIEMAEGAIRPTWIPDILKPFMIYEVPLTDDRFSNKRLGDVDYATKLYRKIRTEGVSEYEE